MFHVGQIIECIRDADQFDCGGDHVKVGAKYTVVATYTINSPKYPNGVMLAGMRRNHPDFGDGWSVHRFRTIVEKKTDISFAHEILNRVSRKDRVRA